MRSRGQTLHDVCYHSYIVSFAWLDSRWDGTWLSDCLPQHPGCLPGAPLGWFLQFRDMYLERADSGGHVYLNLARGNTPGTLLVPPTLRNAATEQERILLAPPSKVVFRHGIL